RLGPEVALRGRADHALPQRPGHAGHGEALLEDGTDRVETEDTGERSAGGPVAQVEAGSVGEGDAVGGGAGRREVGEQRGEPGRRAALHARAGRELLHEEL